MRSEETNYYEHNVDSGLELSIFFRSWIREAEDLSDGPGSLHTEETEVKKIFGSNHLPLTPDFSSTVRIMSSRSRNPRNSSPSIVANVRNASSAADKYSAHADCDEEAEGVQTELEHEKETSPPSGQFSKSGAKSIVKNIERLTGNLQRASEQVVVGKTKADYDR
jgi:hypothetical protein